MPFALRAAKIVNRALLPLGMRIARSVAPAAVTGAAPPLTLPGGHSRDAILASLLSLEMDRPEPGELQAYGRADCDRFIQTLSLVLDQPGAALEIGANPYFTTILLKQFRSLDLHLTNYFSGPAADSSQDVAYTTVTGRRIAETFRYSNVNVETMRLSQNDDAFDVVLFCEVLEHMTNDPLAALAEIKRVLKPGGYLVLTTPNAVRLENVARLVAGYNLYDPYSGYGPYGRHNREYTVGELERLMLHCGFVREILFTADVSPPAPDGLAEAAAMAHAARGSDAETGQYIFSRWRNAAPMTIAKPSWLYRSYPREELV